MTMTTMRFFNTAGPIKTDIHYHVPLLSRLDVDDLLLLIRQGKYFVLHAPRQTGKTSALFALRDQLNASGEFRCVYVNVEVGQSARENLETAMRAILGELEVGGPRRAGRGVGQPVAHGTGKHRAQWCAAPSARALVSCGFAALGTAD